MPTPSKVGVNYIIFNELWDDVLENESNQPIKTIELNKLKTIYFDYLSNALKNLQQSHTNIAVTVWLIEISESGIKEVDLREQLFNTLPYVRIYTIPFMKIRNYISAAKRLAKGLYRSPNELHEFLILHIIKLSTTPYIAILDTDNLFLRQDALNIIFQSLEEDKDKWIGCIMEKGIKRPYNDGFTQMRERMHSVALFIIKDRFNKGFTETTNWRIDTFDKVKLIQNDECRDYYHKYKFFDTLALLTDLFKYNFGVNRIKELNKELNSQEFEKLTIVNDLFVHSKYLHGIDYIFENLKDNKFISSIQR
ncbi:MAG: hypothetical protein OCD02_14005 [Spirochaetaceae bacterium]